MSDASTDLTEYDELVGRLDLRAKVTLLTGAAAFTLTPAPEIGLAEVRLSDGPTGVRGLSFNTDRAVALLPNATLLASAWSEETAHEVGGLLAEEAQAQGIHAVLGPTINLHRSALGGRLFEAFSEDPLLSGVLAAAYVQGMQAHGVGACLKHLAANESETDRTTMNSVVDEATLREVYLLPFEIAVAESEVWSVMAAYNDVNGVPATEQDHLINEVLKGEWAYDGLVMSDWFATKTAGPAANGGLDLVMPGPDGPWGEALVSAVESGEVDERVIDEHLRRLLRFADRVGALGRERPPATDLPEPDGPARAEQLRRLAAAGMTVLTNRDETLPFSRSASVALIGRHAIETMDMGGGSAQVNPPYQASVAEGLRALLGEDRTVVVDGVPVRARPTPARDTVVTDPDTGEQGLHLRLLSADGTVLEEQHGARTSVVAGLHDEYDAPVHAVSLRAVVDLDGPAEIGVLGVGGWRLRVGEHDDEFSLEVAGTGFAEEMFAPPTRTRTLAVADRVLVEADVVLPGAAEGNELASSGRFGLVAGPAPRGLDEVVAEATRAARECDVAVVVVGLTEEQETESVDKTTLALPGEQDTLVRAVAAAATRTVVVVNAATPVLMPWLPDVDAVLWAGLPGQEGGHAVAAALLGDLEPAGRLVTTFPAADGAAPAWSVTPIDGDLVYAEGPFLGYRGHHAGRAPAPAFWFGHGLGYTTWEYGEAELSDDDGSPTVLIPVTNIGDRAGREVVQVYLQPAEPDQPVRLVGWQDVTTEPGETAPVSVRTDPRMWRRWDDDAGGWTRLAPGGQLLVARGLGDVRASVDLDVVRPD